MPASGRRTLLLGGAALLAGAARAGANAAADYAAFTELSPDNKLMQPGWNRRIFTNTDSRKGDAIQCDFATGVLTLAPGSYHLSGMSMVLYGTAGDPPETTTIRSPAAAGYCRLRIFGSNARVDASSLRALDNGDPSVICIGSPASANMVPSVFEAFFEAARRRSSCLSINRATSLTRSISGCTRRSRSGTPWRGSASAGSRGNA